MYGKVDTKVVIMFTFLLPQFLKIKNDFYCVIHCFILFNFRYNYAKTQMQAGDQKVSLGASSHILAASQAGK